MIGYMTAKQAKAEGFTHHASYYGIPLWIGQPDSETPMIATKWAPLEYLMSVFHWIEGAVGGAMWPDEEPAFMFKVGRAIE